MLQRIAKIYLYLFYNVDRNNFLSNGRFRPVDVPLLAPNFLHRFGPSFCRAEDCRSGTTVDSRHEPDYLRRCCPSFVHHDYPLPVANSRPRSDRDSYATNGRRRTSPHARPRENPCHATGCRHRSDPSGARVARPLRREHRNYFFQRRFLRVIVRRCRLLLAGTSNGQIAPLFPVAILKIRRSSFRSREYQSKIRRNSFITITDTIPSSSKRVPPFFNP